MLEGTIAPLEGIRQICDQSTACEERNSYPLIWFVATESETDHFFGGDSKLYSSAFLQKQLAELDAYMESIQPELHEALTALLVRCTT